MQSQGVGRVREAAHDQAMVRGAGKGEQHMHSAHRSCIRSS